MFLITAAAVTWRVDAGASSAPDACPGGVWNQQVKIANPHPYQSDVFGNSVAVSGDTAVVGVSSDDTAAGQNAGSAYIFVRSGAAWVQQAQIFASDARASDEFGVRVAISGDIVVVGSRFGDSPVASDAGAAYVFVRSGTVWTEQAKLTAFDGAFQDFFGESVAIDGDTLIIGAWNDDIGSSNVVGSAYIYTRSGTVWSLQQKLTGPGASSRFGEAVAIAGDTAVIGAPLVGVFPNAGRGAAYIYVRSGTTWTQQQALTGSNTDNGDGFGKSVDISGDTAVIGANGDDAPFTQQGSAFIFVRSGAVWSEQAQLLAADAAAEDYFGLAVSVSGDTAIVGAQLNNVGAGSDHGSAYMFRRTGTSWSQQQLTPTDNLPGDQFGNSVSIDGDTAIVGAAFDDVSSASNLGSVYIFGENCPPPDGDGDGIPDATDNCPLTANPDQANNDGDAQGDACDTDDDNDGVADGVDNCQFAANPDQTDADTDGIGDPCDPDDDNDGRIDGNDNCQFVPNPGQEDNDLDGIGNVCDTDDDNDTVPDSSDNCPMTANTDQANTDGDGQGDACDPDDDNDGNIDGNDNCPLVANPGQEDNDLDGIGNICDTDDDNDTVPDTSDNCPLTANTNQANNDGDGQGDVCDPDDDNDGVPDEASGGGGTTVGPDNCRFTPNPSQADNDADGQGDACDSDDDNDGVLDTADNCQFAQNPDQANNDGDPFGDVCDPDDDNDGVPDNGPATGGSPGGPDNCRFTANPSQADNDADGQGDACDPDDDNDGVLDTTDNCQFAQNPDQANNDGDPFGDVCDPDDDNDGIQDFGDGGTTSNGPDNCRFTPNPSQANNDGDALGDACDPDDDNDGVPDTADSCPFSQNADQADNDGDGQGNACDPDDDNDTVLDGADNCPMTANTGQANNDGDSLGDVCDPDDDNDGVADGADNCPFASNPDQTDTDADGTGNACDTDDDGDGVTDASDNCPLTANTGQANSDGDAMGDACDPDDDNDGVPDTSDAFPLDPTEWVDTDGDGTGNNADADDDNDGQTDADEIACGSDPLSAASKSTDTDGDNRPNCVDTDDDGDGHTDTAEQSAGSDPLNAASTPEVCDGVDNDLNDGVDEGFPNTDGDSQANCVDTDDDGDGQTDADETACGSDPLNALSKSTDTDNDGRPNCVDSDDDNDLVPDATDNCPLVANPDQADSDGDGIGNACDGPAFNFTGFFQPVDNLPIVNVANAGSSIPLKFSLGGYQGLGIFQLGFPASGQVSCSVSEPAGTIEETVNPGSSTLTYDSTIDRYQYVWRTHKSWAGTCRLLIVRFVDGTERYAKFRFK